MKGTVFQKEVEVKIEAQGESWRPGDTVQGQYWIKNHSSVPYDASQVEVALCHGDEKAVKAKEEGAFDFYSSPISSPGSIVSQELSGPFAFQFPLPLHAPVTDKKSSLYLVYGKKENRAGMLRLTVLMHPHIEDALLAVETAHRFVRKSVNAGKKGWVDVKLDPPDGKEYSMVEQLVLSFFLTRETLKMEAEFTVKTVDGMVAGLKFKKEKKNFEMEWPVSELLHSFNQRVNKEKVEKAFADMLLALRGGDVLRGA
jgi:hypothetical protein